MELANWGDFRLQRPVEEVVQLPVAETPPLQEPVTLALGARRSLESCTAMEMVADHLLPDQADVASKSPIWILVGKGVRVGVLVVVDVAVFVAVSVGVLVGVDVSVGVSVAVAVGV